MVIINAESPRWLITPRVWDPENKKMFFPTKASWDESFVWLDEKIYDRKNKNDMAYIMLPLETRDVNNKAIYLNDIVKVHKGYGGDHSYDECIAIVMYSYDEATFYLYAPHTYYNIVGQDWNWVDVEVLGNIFENQDLLAPPPPPPVKEKPSCSWEINDLGIWVSSCLKNEKHERPVKGWIKCPYCGEDIKIVWPRV